MKGLGRIPVTIHPASPGATGSHCFLVAFSTCCLSVYMSGTPGLFRMAQPSRRLPRKPQSLGGDRDNGSGAKRGQAHSLPAIKIIPKQISTSSLEGLGCGCLRGAGRAGNLRERFGVQLVQMDRWKRARLAPWIHEHFFAWQKFTAHDGAKHSISLISFPSLQYNRGISQTNFSQKSL